MSTAQFELYHGIVLAQIIRSPKINLKLLERNNEYGWGTYEVIDNQTIHRVFIKFTSQVKKSRKGSSYCQFTFSVDDINKLRQIETDRNLLICLVCSDEEVCTLEWEDIDEARLLFEKVDTSISVSWTKNSSLHVKCRREEISRTVPRNRLKNFNWT